MTSRPRPLAGAQCSARQAVFHFPCLVYCLLTVAWVSTLCHSVAMWRASSAAHGAGGVCNLLAMHACVHACPPAERTVRRCTGVRAQGALKKSELAVGAGVFFLWVLVWRPQTQGYKSFTPLEVSSPLSLPLSAHGYPYLSFPVRGGLPARALFSHLLH